MRRILKWIVGVLLGGFGIAFAVVFGTVFRQNIEVLSESFGTDNLLLEGWRIVRGLGLELVVALGFFFFGGAAIALWIDGRLRKGEESKREKAKFASNSTGRFVFPKKTDSGITLDQAKSENVSHWWWYFNDGGTMTIKGVLIGAQFERKVSKPEIFCSIADTNLKWREFFRVMNL
jgi:hypothetical protein